MLANRMCESEQHVGDLCSSGCSVAGLLVGDGRVATTCWILGPAFMIALVLGLRWRSSRRRVAADATTRSPIAI